MKYRSHAHFHVAILFSILLLVAGCSSGEEGVAQESAVQDTPKCPFITPEMVKEVCQIDPRIELSDKYHKQGMRQPGSDYNCGEVEATEFNFGEKPEQLSGSSIQLVGFDTDDYFLSDRNYPEPPQQFEFDDEEKVYKKASYRTPLEKQQVEGLGDYAFFTIYSIYKDRDIKNIAEEGYEFYFAKKGKIGGKITVRRPKGTYTDFAEGSRQKYELEYCSTEEAIELARRIVEDPRFR